MKAIWLMILGLSVTTSGFADNPSPLSCQDVSCGPMAPLTPSIFSQYKIITQGYQFALGNAPSGASWGGQLLIDNNNINGGAQTLLCCQDADQFFLVTNNQGQSCYLDSDIDPFGQDFSTIVRWPTGGAVCQVSPTDTANLYDVTISVIK